MVMPDVKMIARYTGFCASCPENCATQSILNFCLPFDISFNMMKSILKNDYG
jgi:hypothetical protein